MKEICVISEILEKLKSTGNRKSIRLSHFQKFLGFDDDKYKRALSVINFPKTKSGLSVVSGWGLNYKVCIGFDLNYISKYVGIDFIISDKKRGFERSYKNEGNDMTLTINKKHSLPNGFIKQLINDYILNAGENVNSIFDSQKDTDRLTFTRKSIESEKEKQRRVKLGIDEWEKNKIYINPDDKSDLYFRLNGLSFRWHTHHYNWPTCMTEQRTPSNHEARIIKKGLSSGLFDGVYMYDEHAMAVSASCFS